MFINVIYKDVPELSAYKRSSETDLSLEKSLLVNPKCLVRIMLEYIRKRCKLGTFTNFDLCDESGGLKGLFEMPTYAYATDHFEQKRTYYVIVIKQEKDRRLSVLPQLNRDNVMYDELKSRVKKFIATGEVSPQVSPPPSSVVVRAPAATKATKKK